MSDQLQIIPFEPEFINNYYKIEKQLISKENCFSIQRLQDIISREDVVSYCAKQNNEIVAYCIIQLSIIGKQINVIELNVAKEHQRKKIGTKIMKIIESSARHLSYPKIHCQIEASNEDALLFLKKLRFKKIKDLNDFLGVGNNGYEYVKRVRIKR